MDKELTRELDECETLKDVYDLSLKVFGGKNVFCSTPQEGMKNMKTKGLTLKEAIESGKPFRRNGLDNWLRAGYCFVNFIEVGTEATVYIAPSDVLATDWEIKAEPREFWILRADGKLDVAYSSMEQIVAMNPELVPGGYKIIHVREVLE